MLDAKSGIARWASWRGVIQQLFGPKFIQFWPPHRLANWGHFTCYLLFVYLKKRGLSLGHLPTSCPRSYWMTPESEHQSWGDSLIDFHLPSWCHLTWHFTVCACWSLITKFVVYENSTSWNTIHLFCLGLLLKETKFSMNPNLIKKYKKVAI